MSYALVTPSYAPDHDRCRLLVESVRRLVPEDVHHYVIVDSRDVRLFRDLASPRTSVLVVEDILPKWIRRKPSAPNCWSGPHTPYISTWVLQQLVKLSAFDAIDEDVSIFCDSDVAFIRAFDPQRNLISHDGRLLLRRGVSRYDELERWHNTAACLLGLADREVPIRNYVDNLIAWRRENVMAMRARIASASNENWLETVSRHASLSEYVLYGVFVDCCLGLAEAGHAPFQGKLVKPSWKIDLTVPGAMDEFFQAIDREHVGIMIHSKDGVPVESYAPRVRSFWPVWVR